MKRRELKILSLLLVITVLITGLQLNLSSIVKADSDVKLVTKSDVIMVGDRKKIKLKNLSQKAKVSYKSTKETVVSVNNKGEIKGKKVGNAQIKISVTLNKKTTKLVYKVVVKKGKSYKVSFKTYGAKKIKTQKIKRGGYAKLPKEPIKKGYQFVGWFKTKKPSDWSKRFKFNKSRIKSNITLHAVWVNVNKDTDKDGIADEVEEKLGTNKKKKDTDNDGLTDYQEVVLVGTNPLMKDTDKNGISDYKDDRDGDKLSNGEEVKLGSNPTVSDTDSDNLNDYEEVKKHKTSPVKKDTDGDGAEDGWEINNGFDPIKFNASFEIVKDTGKASEYQPVVASVKMDVSGKQVESLSVEPVNYSDNHWVTPAIAGYLGSAYEFNIDGNFSRAELTFEYDTKIGSIGKNFEPRIYYMDNATGKLTELENQRVENGKVTAITTHFSTYILLNKIEYDKVWDSEIKPPSKKTESGDDSLDVVFVIDYSFSMVENDPHKMFRDVSINFIDNLRENKDKASVIKFVRYPSLLQELTYNKNSLKAAIAGIEYDNGRNYTSGTNGSGAYKLALEQLKNSKAANKYIIFMTDGEDTHTEYSYSELINESMSNEVKVYTIGLGGASDQILKNIAQSTGGKFFHASTKFESSSDNNGIPNIYKVLLSIQEEINNVDTNGDGISDYYNELIKSGKLVLNNGSKELAGTDFNVDKDGKPSDDYDGDGLKNGEELQIKKDTKNGQVYLSMKSDPKSYYSDKDPWNDYVEVKTYKTNPMVANLTKGIGDLLNDDVFTYSLVTKKNDEDPAFAKAYKDIFEKVINSFSADQVAEDCYLKTYVDFFGYDTDKELKFAKLTNDIRDIKEKLIDTIADTLSNINGLVQIIAEIKNAKTINELTTVLKKLPANKISEVLNSIANVDLDTVDKGLKYFGYFNEFIDIASAIDRLSEIDENVDTFKENMNIISRLTGSNDEYARRAAGRIQKHMENSMENIRDTIVSKASNSAMNIGTDFIIDKLGGLQLEVATLAKDITAFLLKIDDEIEQRHNVEAYHRLSRVIIESLEEDITRDGDYYQIKQGREESATRKVKLLAQCRILGLNEYIDLYEDEGVLQYVINSFKDDELTNFKKNTNDFISRIKELLKANGLSFSSKFEDKINEIRKKVRQNKSNSGIF